MPEETTKFASKLDELKSQSVAAPPEGTPTAEDFHNSREWVERKPSGHFTEDEYWLAFAEAYAAAVSKASREETANLTMQLNNYKSACGSKTPAELLKFLHYQGARISELEQEIEQNGQIFRDANALILKLQTQVAEIRSKP